MSHHYPAEVFWSDEDEGFIALARDLQGCSAFGETRLEALDELEHAIAAWIAAAEDAGNPIPSPSKPPAEASHSGKLLLRLPKTLHGKLAKQAENEQVSLNQYVVYLLSERSTAQAVGKAVVAVAGQLVFRRVSSERPGLQAMATGLGMSLIDVSSMNFRQNPAIAITISPSPGSLTAGE